jgi:predicted peroxiredoxin
VKDLPPGAAPSASLAVLLADPNGLPEALVRLEEARGEIGLFLMHDGVLVADSPRIAALVEEGLEATLCARDAELRGLREGVGAVRFGAQVDHALLVRSADRLWSYTGATEGALETQRSAGVLRAITVRLTAPPDHPRTHAALRSALGYASLGLTVTVSLTQEARRLLAERPEDPVAARAFAALFALGHLSDGGGHEGHEVIW